MQPMASPLGITMASTLRTRWIASMGACLMLLAALTAVAAEPASDTTSASSAAANPAGHVYGSHDKGKDHCKKYKADYDVCVVGCGGSGGYTAVKLKQLGYRVLVLEKEDRCGGHCETVQLPGPGGFPLDTGVNVYENASLVLQTFKDWGVTAIPASFSTPGTTYDFYANSPQFVVFPPPDAAQQAAFGVAVQKWYTMFYTYFSALLTPNAALPDFDTLPADTRDALLGSFKELLAWLAVKDPVNYSVDAQGNPWWQPLYPLWLAVVNIGPGPVFEATGYVVLRTLTPSIMDMAVKGAGWVVSGGCQTIYDKFRNFLGSGVKLGVKFTASRSRTGVVKVVYRQADQHKSVRTSCRRMVVSSLQSLDNMRAFITDLDTRERTTFEGVTYNLFGTAVVNIVSKNASNPTSINVLDLSSKDLPTTVGFYQVHPAFAQAFSVSWTPDDDSEEATAARMHANFTRWSDATNSAFTVPASIEATFFTPPDLHQHTPRAKNPKDTPQMYKRLYGLQGYRQMYYTGALYSYNGQRSVWTYSQWLIDTYFRDFSRC